MEAKNGENKKPDKAKDARKRKSAPAVEAISEEENAGELNAPRWSVVSFEKRLVSNLTYAEAASKSEEFSAQKVSGLCIVTDEAAERIS